MHPVDAFLLTEGEDVAWESFHENSKTSRVEPHVYFGRHPSDRTVVTMMQGLRDVKPYADRERLALPALSTPSGMSVEDALLGRESAREFATGPVDLVDLATVLRCSQGVSRDNIDNSFPRPFRAVPSGGALYPLEVYLWSRSVTDLPTGLYHHDPRSNELDVLGEIDLDTAFVQQDLVRSAAVVLLMSAVFFRSVFKYGDRGYRFVLIEAGHLAQNILLAARSRGLAGVPIGGYFDREVDRALGLDGLHESVVYSVLIGRPAQS